MKKMKVNTMILCALFAALSAILSQVIIPIGAIPVNMTHLSIFLAAGLLGAKYGSVSQIIFVLLGALGVPVFSEFTGGLGAIIGPRGGFIIGYIVCTVVTGLLIEKLGKSIMILIVSMISGMLFNYLLGSLWYSHITQTGLIAAFSVCILPFLPGDAIKIILSSILIKRLNPAIQNISGNV